MVLAMAAVFALISAQAAGFNRAQLEWIMAAALLIIAAVTLLQLFGAGRFGGKHFLVIGATPIYIPFVAHLGQIADYAVLTSFMIVASLAFLCVAHWLPRLSRVITPVVSSCTLLLIFMMILPFAFRLIGEAPEGVSPDATPVLVCLMLAVMAVLSRTLPASLQSFTPLAGILVGVLTAAGYDWYSFVTVGEPARLFGLPIGQFPGFSLPARLDVWALLPPFVLVALVHAIRVTTNSFMAQQAEIGDHMEPDYRLAQGSIYANGIGVLLSGLAGSTPVTSYAPLSVSLIRRSKGATRTVGVTICCLIVVIALFPRLTIAMLLIPLPVLGTLLLLAVLKMAAETLRTLVKSCHERQDTIVAWSTMLTGILIATLAYVRPQLFGEGFGAILGNGFVVGSVVAIGLTVVLNAFKPRPMRFDGLLDAAVYPRVDAFAKDVATKSHWGPRAGMRLRAAVEEAIASQEQVYEKADEGKLPHLTVRAYPARKYIDVDILTTLESESVESHLAIMNAMPDHFDERLLSLRLLRHYASDVRCRHYHGLTVISVRVPS